VAAEIREADSASGSFVRNDREIIPMTGNVFKNHQDVAFYHEVYNLRRDSLGMCHYRIEYALYNGDREERRIDDPRAEPAALGADLVGTDPDATQPERVGDDRDRREGHGEGGDHRSWNRIQSVA